MSSQTAAPPAPPLLTHRQIMFIIFGLMAGMFLSSLDQTIVGTSIRTIADDLDGLALQASVTTAYLITSTVMTPIYNFVDFGGPRHRRPLRRLGRLEVAQATDGDGRVIGMAPTSDRRACATNGPAFAAAGLPTGRGGQGRSGQGLTPEVFLSVTSPVAPACFRGSARGKRLQGVERSQFALDSRRATSLVCAQSRERAPTTLRESAPIT